MRVCEPRGGPYIFDLLSEANRSLLGGEIWTREIGFCLYKRRVDGVADALFCIGQWRNPPSLLLIWSSFGSTAKGVYLYVFWFTTDRDSCLIMSTHYYYYCLLMQRDNWFQPTHSLITTIYESITSSVHLWIHNFWSPLCKNSGV